MTNNNETENIRTISWEKEEAILTKLGFRNDTYNTQTTPRVNLERQVTSLTCILHFKKKIPLSV